MINLIKIKVINGSGKNGFAYINLEQIASIDVIALENGDLKFTISMINNCKYCTDENSFNLIVEVIEHGTV